MYFKMWHDVFPSSGITSCPPVLILTKKCCVRFKIWYLHVNLRPKYKKIRNKTAFLSNIFLFHNPEKNEKIRYAVLPCHHFFHIEIFILYQWHTQYCINKANYTIWNKRCQWSNLNKKTALVIREDLKEEKNMQFPFKWSSHCLALHV